MFAQTYKRELTAASYGWNDIADDLAEAEVSPDLKLSLDRCDRYKEKNKSWMRPRDLINIAVRVVFCCRNA